jgi:CheY-like chemotaxis protein
MVKDSGIGIDENAMAALFAPFVQADASTTRRFGGTGLGLAISRRLIQAMGGQITVESSPGEGSTFRFHISFDRAISSPTASARRMPANLSALLVSDRTSGATIHIARFREAGVVAEHVSSSQQGLDRWRELSAAGRAPQFLVVQDELPDGSGAELARRIRNLDPIRETRIVLLAPLNRTFPAEDRALFVAVCHTPLKCHGFLDALTRNGDDAGSSSSVERSSNLPSVHGLRVLLADDNPVNRKLGERQLTRLDMVVTLACNGAEAVELAKTSIFDLVLMDCQMPEMDGYEAARLLRRSNGGANDPSIPIIALTAHALDGDRERCLEAGMDDYLTKPLDTKRLLDLIVQVLGQRQDDRRYGPIDRVPRAGS